MSNYETLHDAVFDALALALGLSEEGANALIRYSYPSGESQPFDDLLPDENRCYIRLSSANLGGVGSKDRQYGDKKVGSSIEFVKGIQMLDGVTATFVFYGPDAVVLAERAMLWMHEDEVKQRLETDNLAVVSDATVPAWLPELVNGRWVNRADLEVRMYRMTKYEKPVEAMVNLPEILIKRSI